VRGKVKDFVSVQVGYSFRSRIEASMEGNVGVVQMKDLLDDDTVSCDDLVHVVMEDVKEHHLLKKGDLLFRSRGLLSTAAILLEDPGKAVSSAPLLRIRVTKPQKLLPEYLCWFIKQRDAQAFLASRARGSMLKIIGKQAIEELEISLPSLEMQKNIAELALLSHHEQVLLSKLADKRERYIAGLLRQFAKGE